MKDLDILATILVKRKGGIGKGNSDVLISEWFGFWIDLGLIFGATEIKDKIGFCTVAEEF